MGETGNGDGDGRQRILTGVRPTGALHLGHYAGALENWLRLQDEYDCFFLIADYQVSDHADDIDRVRDAVIEVATDWLGRLERNPTLKAEMDELEERGIAFDEAEREGKRQVVRERGAVPVAFFTYPIMQVANILMPRAHLVPVGEDQLPHIEMTRETARRFNRRFGEVFPEPRGLVGRVPRLVGIDGGAKMSKSLGNTIDLKDDAAEVERKVMRMYTDPTRLRATDPGHVEGNPVFMYHDAFNPDADEVDDLKTRYREGRVGDVEVKRKLAAALNAFLDPIRERRAHYEAQPAEVRAALARGTEHARTVASATMADVRSALGLNYLDG